MEAEYQQRFGAAVGPAIGTESPLPPHLRKRKEAVRSVAEDNSRSSRGINYNQKDVKAGSLQAVSEHTQPFSDGVSSASGWDGGGSALSWGERTDSTFAAPPRESSTAFSSSPPAGAAASSVRPSLTTTYTWHDPAAGNTSTATGTNPSDNTTSITASTSLTTYTQDLLKQIGGRCANKLPPASAIQAMFLYEMQRQTEAEKLFHAQIFELAKAEDHTHIQDRRIGELEKRMAELEKRAAARDVDERIATSNVRLNAHQDKLNSHADSLSGAKQKLNEIQQQLEELAKSQAESASAMAAAATTPDTTASSTVAEDVTVLKEEINVLFNDRDGIIEMISGIKSSTERLEGSMRMLSLQRGSASSSPASTHRVVVKNSNGELIDFGLPKVNAAVGLRENRAPIQPFQPGKPWGS